MRPGEHALVARQCSHGRAIEAAAIKPRLPSFDVFVYGPIESTFGSTGMHTIGLIGGMSWESTALCYELINERVHDRMGKLHSVPLLMSSYDSRRDGSRFRDRMI